MYKEQIHEQSNCFRLVYDVPGIYINDHCFLRGTDELFHLFYIQGPVGKGCYDLESEISIGHATSTDLWNWTRQTDAILVDTKNKYEADHVFAPYVIEKNNTFFMFYAGINARLKMESMCLATSHDLYHWVKHPTNPIFRPSLINLFIN